MKSTITTFIFLCALSSAAIPAMADAPAASPPQNVRQGSGWCAQNQQECQEKMAKFLQWCQDNPQKCAAKKEQHRAKIEAYCKQNPNNPRCEKFIKHKENETGNKTNDNTVPPPSV
ncbi:MAG: hypothetical protein WBR29_10190 [Gammaproteobacteria bacterium]